MTYVVSGRFQPNQVERLRKYGRRYGHTPSQLVVYFTEEALRKAEFSGIEFRDSSIGRIPYLTGTGLAIWEVVMIAKDYNMDAHKVAEYTQNPIEWIKEALAYYKKYPDNIDELVEENNSMTYEDLKKILPGLRLFKVGE